MYLRITQRHNRDGSSVTYYALAESVWNADAKRREAHVVHSLVLLQLCAADLVG